MNLAYFVRYICFDHKLQEFWSLICDFEGLKVRRNQAEASPKEHRRNLEKWIFAIAQQLRYSENDQELKGEVKSFLLQWDT
jgi:hypothetical protein